MAKFLFTVWPFPGHVHPNVAIAKALRSRGHDIGFYTGGSITRSLETHGFVCFPFQAVDEEHATGLVTALDAHSLQWLRGAAAAKRLLNESLLGTVDAQLNDLRAVLSTWRPDVLVCDPAMWGPLLVLRETEHIPLAVMSYVAGCMLPGPEGPILGVPLPRPRGRVGRIARSMLRFVADYVAAGTRREAELIRARHGLPAMRTSVTDFSGRVPLYLVPSTPAYDRSRRDLPASVRYVGPCEWDKSDTVALPHWLHELPPNRPVVYVTEGTMHAKAPLVLRAALAGLAHEPVQVIATTGRRREPAALNLGPIPSNARVEQYVPHSDLLPRTDVVITTGGTGTVMAALSAGVPLLVIPTAWDQPENAWRVVEAGAGLRVKPSRCTPEVIRSAVDRLLNEPSFRQNARRLGADLRKHGGAVEAAELLESLIGHPDPPVVPMTAEASPASIGVPTAIGRVRSIH